MKQIWNWFLKLDNTNKVTLMIALLGMGGSVFIFFQNKDISKKIITPNYQNHIEKITTGDGSPVNITIDTTKEEYVQKLEAAYAKNEKILKEKNLSDIKQQKLLAQKSALEARLTHIEDSYKKDIAFLKKEKSKSIIQTINGDDGIQIGENIGTIHIGNSSHSESKQ